MERLLSALCLSQKATLVEFNGESDHVHLLIDYHPETSLSKLTNILKTGSSREIKRYHPELNQFAWRKNALWSSGYFVCSVGGAPIEVLKQYIQQQERPH
jgi:putative transposase